MLLKGAITFRLVCETQISKFEDQRPALFFASSRFRDLSLRHRYFETRLKFADTHDFSRTILYPHTSPYGVCGNARVTSDVGIVNSIAVLSKYAWIFPISCFKDCVRIVLFDLAWLMENFVFIIKLTLPFKHIRICYWNESISGLHYHHCLGY